MAKCRYCGKEILKFAFSDHDEWWHMPNSGLFDVDSTARRRCRDTFGIVQTAEPADA